MISKPLPAISDELVERLEVANRLLSAIRLALLFSIYAGTFRIAGLVTSNKRFSLRRS